MSLASKLQNKLQKNRYELTFDDIETTFYLSSLTVAQRSKIIKIKDEQKRNTMITFLCAFDEAGDPVADTLSEVEALPDSIIGIVGAVVLMHSQGASHKTLDSWIEAYNNEMNPDFTEEVEAVDTDELNNPN